MGMCHCSLGGIKYYCALVIWALEPPVSQLVFLASQHTFAYFHLAFGNTKVLQPTLPTKIHHGPGEQTMPHIGHPKPCNLCKHCQFGKFAVAKFDQVVIAEKGQERHFPP